MTDNLFDVVLYSNNKEYYEGHINQSETDELSMILGNEMIDRAYIEKIWEPISKIEEYIYLGGIASPKSNLTEFDRYSSPHYFILSDDIEVVISLMCFNSFWKFPRFVDHHYLLIDDVPSAPIYETFDYFADVIHRCKTEKRNVFVHCHMGVSRSVSVLCAYYIKYRNLSVDEALRFLRRRRSVISPNHGFLLYLIRYEKLIRSKNESV